MNTVTNPPGAEDAPRRVVTFREVFPSLRVSLGLLESGSIGRAVRVLAHIRQHAQENPDTPGVALGFQDLNEPITRAISHLWGAGLVRLLVGIDPHTYTPIGLAIPA